MRLTRCPSVSYAGPRLAVVYAPPPVTRVCEWCGFTRAFRRDEAGDEACQNCVSERAAVTARDTRRNRERHSFVLAEFRAVGAVV